MPCVRSKAAAARVCQSAKVPALSFLTVERLFFVMGQKVGVGMPSNFVARGAEAYDGYMGRWSQRLAPLFLDFAGLVAGERVLDVGCGTGNLPFAICAREDVASVEAIDFEPLFVEAVRERATDGRITARQGDACELPFPDGQFDRALSMLVLHFVSDPQRAVAEMRRVVRANGTAAATT